MTIDPRSSLEDHIHSVLEIEPPCEYENSGPGGDCRGANPADYLVVFRSPLVCGCEPRSIDKYFCDQCWMTRMSGSGFVTHYRCGTVHVPAMANVLRITRIKP